MQRKFSQFLASTAPAALGAVAALAAAAPAYADTTVNTGTTITSTLNTSTAGNVTVSGTGTLTLGASGPVVNIDSSNTATVDANGTIYAGTALSPYSGAIGVQIQSGVTTTVTNQGTISVLEDYSPSTTNPADLNGVYLNGPVSQVSGRYGIYAGTGTINASINNTGGITVDGENSAGIEVDGTLNGSLSSEGAINILGDNSYGVKLAAVNGGVTIGGTVTVIGAGAQAYVQTGAVSGQILIDGAISNGYTYTDTSGISTTLLPNNLNANKAVVEIDGNVGNGIEINTPLTSTSADTNTGSITAYGNNVALQLGSTTAMTVGATTTNNGSYALGIDGSVTANGTYSSTPAYAVVIGTTTGGNVTLTNGMEVYGSVSATTVDYAATAILINAGSSVSSLFNTGTIKVTASQLASNNSLYAIQDLSGTLTSITNQGYITVTGTTSSGAVTSSAAIDLRDATTAVNITQSYDATALSDEATDKTTTGYNPYNTTEYAGITGNILLGTGGSTIDIESGTVTGNLITLGGDNAIAMGDTTKWTGNITFGNSGTQSITLNNHTQYTGTVDFENDIGTVTVNNSAIFYGTVLNGANVAVNVTGGTFGANSTAASTIGSLHVYSGASLEAYIGSGAASHLAVTGTATFDSGSLIGLKISSLTNAVGTYDVLTAGSVTGTLSAASLDLPVLFTGSVTTTGTDVYVTIAKATAAQLGLTTAQAAAYKAILNDAANNTLIQNTLLSIYDKPTLRGRFNELLPDYAGGTLDFVTRTTRMANQRFEDDSTMFSISNSSAWLQPIVFRGSRAFGDTPGFHTTGGGLSAGYEKVTPVGNVGFQLGWATGSVKADTYQSVKSNEFELGLFWRKSAGPLYLWAGGNVGRESFDSKRSFNGQYSTTTSTAVTVTNFAYNAAGHWAGWSADVSAGGSYTLPVSEHFSLRPRAVINYDRLQENGYVESGDTPIALTVQGRTNSQTTATTTLTAIWSAGPSSHEGRPFSVAVEGGRRSWISGDLGTTTATFETGDTYSINGGHLPSAWVSNISIMQGGLDYTWKIGTDVERGSDKGLSYGVTASISIAL